MRQQRFGAILVGVLLSSCFVLVSSPPVAALGQTAQIEAGDEHACAIDQAGAAWCWGWNLYGRLGDGTAWDKSEPIQVNGGLTFEALELGEDHTCGITTSNDAYCWGRNDVGQLGIGSMNYAEYDPQAVTGGHTFDSISVGEEHACASTSAGAAWCWGQNVEGQLGDGTNTNSDEPVAVAGGLTFASISVAGYHSCGLTTGGVDYCWGDNLYGQVGDGTNTDRNTPTAVSGVYTWSSLVAGEVNACGLTTGGDAYCWGRNNDGQVGDGTNTNRNTPTTVTGGHKFASISGGGYYACGLTAARDTYCWGYNGGGRLGDGTNVARWVPTLHAASYEYETIVAGGSLGCGLAAMGVAYCWGDNWFGQVGDGTYNNEKHTAVQVWTLVIARDSDVEVTVNPSFSFSVAGRGTNCNGETNWVTTGGTATAVNVGHITATNVLSAGQDLTIAGNSGSGFSVYVRSTQASQNLRSTGHNWADVAGTYASPAVFGAGERFGYTYQDSTASTSVSNPASANFAALNNATTNKIMGSNSSTTGTGCISFQIGNAATTPAGSYTATVLYTAVPTF